MAKMRLHNSPAPHYASSGSGPVAGAGELPPKGPGPAGMRKTSAVGKSGYLNQNGSGSAPKGMKTIMEGAVTRPKGGGY